jgi:secreted trypsin-like serine protease
MLLAILEPQTQMRCSNEAAVQRQTGRVALTAVAAVDAGSVDSSACSRGSDMPAQHATAVAGAARHSDQCPPLRRLQPNVLSVNAGGCSRANGR